jgi:uncharacterized protein YecE (DUF72 family)
VWEEITIPRYATQVRYGARGGQPNPRFLDARLFNEIMPMPYREAQFEAHAGPFLFEFQRHGMSSEEFCSRLNGFFSQVPKDFQYTVEIHNASLLGTDYRKVLETHSVAHVYNHWSYMSPLAEQYAQLQGFTALFTVLRLLTPSKMSYEPRISVPSRIPKLWRSYADEKSGGALGSAGCERRPSRLCASPTIALRGMPR